MLCSVNFNVNHLIFLFNRTEKRFGWYLFDCHSVLCQFQILYSRIAIVLWRSFAGLKRHCAVRHPPLMPITRTANNKTIPINSITEKKEKKTLRLSSYQVKFIIIILWLKMDAAKNPNVRYTNPRVCVRNKSWMDFYTYGI